MALRVILPILFIILLITGIYAIYPLLSTNDGPQIILNTINLRVEQDTLAQSRLVTQTDEMVRATGVRPLLAEWNLLTECMPEGCDDATYFNFITLVTQHQEIPNQDLIQNLIATYKYWDSEEIVRFSKAMTAVELSVDEAFSRSLEEKWKEIVACDGSCGEENDLYFQAIEIAVEL